jgi:hypothetical protein
MANIYRLDMVEANQNKHLLMHSNPRFSMANNGA